MSLQEGEQTNITLSIGGVEFCLTPVSTDTESDDEDAGDNSMLLSKVGNNEVLIHLTNFTGTLQVENYNITATPKKRKKRAPSKVPHRVTNHAADDRMKNAVEDWDRLRGTDDEPPSKKAFAMERGLNPRTFCKYVRDDPSKRHKLGAAPGKRSLVPDHIAEALEAHVSRIDESADDLKTTPRTVVNSLMRMHPAITRPQAINYVQRTWMKKHGARLHKGTLTKAGQAFIRPHLPDLPPPDDVRVPNAPDDAQQPPPDDDDPGAHHRYDAAYDHEGAQPPDPDARHHQPDPRRYHDADYEDAGGGAHAAYYG